MDPAVPLAARLISPFEGCFRKRSDGKLIAYADPASPLGKVLRRRGLWNRYLHCQYEPTLELRELSGVPWTIGWGNTGEGIHAGTVWTMAQAEDAHHQAVAERVAMVRQRASRPLADHEAAALASFLYNTGPGQYGPRGKDGLFQLKNADRPSTLWLKAMADDTAGVVREFAKWTKAQGEVLPGLVSRRKAEADLYRGKL